MDTSSECSFDWTDTNSSDSEATCQQRAMKSEDESDFGKTFKKKLQKELFQNGNHDEPLLETPRGLKKNLKRERASSPPAVKRESPAARALAEARVKRELLGAAEPPGRRSDTDEPPPKKRKKKKHKREKLKVDDLPVDANIRERITFEDESPDRPGFEPAPEPEVDSDGRHSDTDEEKTKENNRETLEAETSAAVPPVRAANIRERITFEEDSAECSEPEPEPELGPEPEDAPAGRRLAQYVRAHALLRPAAAGGALLGAGDEVWLVRAPRSLRPAALAGAALAPAARARLRAGGRAYDAAPVAAAPAALLLPAAAWRARGLRVRGALHLRARVPRPRAAPPAPPASPSPPPPPPPPRARHPLLGANYETRAPLAPRTPRNRQPSEEEPTKKKKKKKKKDRPQSPQRPPAEPDRPAPGRWDSERAIERSLFGV